MTEAPRWRLTNPHYLNITSLSDGTIVEWEHKETSRETGRAVRKMFPVPALLDPNDPSDCNYPGEIIVAHVVEGARNERLDIIFTGSPTPDMEPLNEAAEALTAAERPRWEHPIDTLPVNGGMSSAEQAFMERMMQTFAGAAKQPNATVPQAQYDELKERLARLEAALASQNAATPSTTRRV